jgi:hypothetical protein
MSAARQRGFLAEIPGQVDKGHIRIVFSPAQDPLDGRIRASIIDEEDIEPDASFKTPGQFFAEVFDRGAKRSDRLFFIVDWNRKRHTLHVNLRPSD